MRTTTFLLFLSPLLFLTPYSPAALPITTIAGDPPPTTAPVQPVSVMLLPFHAVTANPDNSWISAAIDEDLAHDLSRNRAIHLVRPSTTQPVAAADGLAAARDAKADRLISGSYQVVDDQLRINAEVIDMSQTQPVAQAKATGRVRDLFQLEDSLAMQLWRILPRPDAQASANDIQVTPLEDYVNGESAPPPEVYQPPRAEVSPGPIYDYPPDYDYTPSIAGYPYGYYGYGYPYFGAPLFFYGGYGFHSGFHDHGGFHGHEGGGHAPTIGHGAAPAFSGGGAHFSGGGHR
jgi:TolB-like protein